MLTIRDTGLGPAASLALFVGSFLVFAVGRRWWLGRRRRALDRLVRDGGASWAALATIWEGAQHLGGEGARRGSRPIGFLSVSGGDLVWQPDKGALRRRHVADRRSLTDVEVVKSAWGRLPSSVVRVRQVWLRVQGHDLFLYLHTETGAAPPDWRFQPR